MKQFKNILQKIETAEAKLCQAENNLQYIKALKSCLFWLIRFDAMAQKSDTIANSAEYRVMFTTGAGWSFFDRVQNSILEYNYGVKPF